MSEQKPIDKAIDKMQKLHDDGGDPETDHILADHILTSFILEIDPVKGPKLVELFDDLIKWYV